MPRLTHLFLFASLLALLCSCAAPAPTVAPALSGAEGLTLTATFTPLLPTPSKIPTATAIPPEVPKPLGSENLPHNVTVVLNEDGSWGIGIGSEAKSIPGAVFDSTGLHLTLDSGRIVDIPAFELQKGIVYDQEYRLLKIYDDQGIISAEYDPGAGQPNSPDFIPGQGWVDIQKLAQDLVCQRGPTCFTDSRGTPIPGGIFVELNSTGIFRSIDALDHDTGEIIGNFLLTQVVTKDKEMAPTTVWVLVQAESSSEPDVNAFIIGVSTIRYRVENKLPSVTENLILYPVQKWRDWMPNGSTWSLEFSKSGYLYSFLTFIERSQIMADKNKSQAIDFLTSSGISFGDDFIIVPFASSPRR